MQKQICVQIDEEDLSDLRSLTLQKHRKLHGALKKELTAAINNHILRLKKELEQKKVTGQTSGVSL